jgi:hypothetical protein
MGVVGAGSCMLEVYVKRFYNLTISWVSLFGHPERGIASSTTHSLVWYSVEMVLLSSNYGVYRMLL